MHVNVVKDRALYRLRMDKFVSQRKALAETMARLHVQIEYEAAVVKERCMPLEELRRRKADLEFLQANLKTVVATICLIDQTLSIVRAKAAKRLGSKLHGWRPNL